MAAPWEVHLSRPMEAINEALRELGVRRNANLERFSNWEVKMAALKKYGWLVLAVVLIVVGYAFVQNPASAGAGQFVRNYFAAGDFAAGVFAIGTFAAGIFSIGVFSIGIFSTGLFSIALFATGFFVIAKYKETLDKQ